MSDKSAARAVKDAARKQDAKATNTKHKEKKKGKKGATGQPCPRLCSMMPTNVPAPGPAQTVLHPRKDVFILKVAKVGAMGDRRCKMELEMVTPKATERKPPGRVDTRETQCGPDPPPCCCRSTKSKKKK